MPRQGSVNCSLPCGLHSWVWPGLWVYAGCPSLVPLPTAHCLPHLFVGSALHRGTSPILSPGTFMLHALLLFSVVTHCALLPRRSCWSPERGLLSDSAEPSLCRDFSMAGPAIEVHI